MAYERDDRWRGGRGERSSYGHRSDWDRDERGRRVDRDERGFFERAGEEISSWFGDEEPERRHGRGERSYGRDRDEGWFSGGRGDDRDRHEGGRGDDRDEPRGSRPMRWTSSNRDYREDYDRGMEGSSRYRPLAGDYARGARGQGGEYGRERGEHDRRGYDRGSEWERDPYRRTSFAGSAASSNYRDPPYDEWRRRHIEEVDREYDDYQRESRSRFEQDFGEWRERRQQKRGLLGRIREHMEVVGRDGEHVGTVDRIAGDRLILTKSDPDSGGTHHSISCTTVDRVEDDRVMLEMDAHDAKQRWRDEDRERPLSEEEGRGEEGPHILDRSFSGTYR